MTSTQWLFEYHLLKAKEDEDSEKVILILTAIRKMLVSLLGLNLLGEPGEKVDDDTFVPLSMLTGRREIIESILEKFDKEKQIQQAIEDSDFDLLSDAIASDSGDMEPIQIDEKELHQKILEAERIEREQQLKSIGVKIVDSTPNAPHITFNIDEDIKYTRELVKEAEKEATEIIKENYKKKPSIKFD